MLCNYQANAAVATPRHNTKPHIQTQMLTSARTALPVNNSVPLYAGTPELVARVGVVVGPAKPPRLAIMPAMPMAPFNSVTTVLLAQSASKILAPCVFPPITTDDPPGRRLITIPEMVIAGPPTSRVWEPRINPSSVVGVPISLDKG